MNSYPVYWLDQDLETVLTDPKCVPRVNILREDNIYRINDPITNGFVAIERFEGNSSYMMMIYAGNSRNNRDLAAKLDCLIVAAGGREVTGEELERVIN